MATRCHPVAENNDDDNGDDNDDYNNNDISWNDICRYMMIGEEIGHGNITSVNQSRKKNYDNDDESDDYNNKDNWKFNKYIAMDRIYLSCKFGKDRIKTRWVMATQSWLNITVINFEISLSNQRSYAYLYIVLHYVMRWWSGFDAYAKMAAKIEEIIPILTPHNLDNFSI